MTKVVVDTNLLVALFAQENQHEAQQARRLFERAESGEVWLMVVPPVLFELYWVLRRAFRLERGEALRNVELLLETGVVHVLDASRVRRALALARKAKTDFADAYLAATAEEHDAAVASFDRRDFKRLGATLQRL